MPWETDLREALKGPDYSWLDDNDRPRAERVWEERPSGAAPDARYQLMTELEGEGLFGCLDKASPHLQSHVRGRVLGARLRGERLTVERALQEAVDRGHRCLSSEASKIFDEISCVAGHAPDGGADVGPVSWDEGGHFGRGDYTFWASGMELGESSGLSGITRMASSRTPNSRAPWDWSPARRRRASVYSFM